MNEVQEGEYSTVPGNFIANIFSVKFTVDFYGNFPVKGLFLLAFYRIFM